MTDVCCMTDVVTTDGSAVASSTLLEDCIVVSLFRLHCCQPLSPPPALHTRHVPSGAFTVISTFGTPTASFSPFFKLPPAALASLY